MYCSTTKGKEAIIRQLGSELHMESDFKIVQNLIRYITKFHLIWPEEKLEDLSPEVE